MRTYDFLPLRSTIEFDRLLNLAENQRAAEEPFPPYSIERLAEDRYQFSLAIAGFSRVSVTAEQNVVTIAGSKAQEAESEFLYGEIARREFKRQILDGNRLSHQRARIRGEITPRLSSLLRAHRYTCGLMRQFAVRAGADADVIAKLPVIQIVSAACACARIAGNFVLLETRFGQGDERSVQHLIDDVVGRLRGWRSSEQRARLDRQVVLRQMRGIEG